MYICLFNTNIIINDYYYDRTTYYLSLIIGLLDINAPVCQYWPEFSCNGKENITIAHILNHQAGLSNAGLEELSHDPYLTCDTPFMTTAMANATPESLPGMDTKYHYLSFGWLLDGIVQKVTGLALQDYVHQEIASKLDLEQDLMIGIKNMKTTSNNINNSILIPDKPITTSSSSNMNTEDLTTSLLPTTQSLATLVMKRRDFEMPKNPANTMTTAVSDSTANDKSNTNDSNTIKKNDNNNNMTTAATTNSRRPPGAPTILMNPTFFNNPRIRRASIPAANGHFSARGLAYFYNALLPSYDSSTVTTTSNKKKLFGSKGLDIFTIKNNKSSNTLIQSSSELNNDTPVEFSSITGNESLLQGEQGRFRLGFQIYPSSSITTTNSNTATTTTNNNKVAFGHVGLGGSIAFCDPSNNNNQIAVAITLNKLSMKSATTKKIVSKIYEQLNLPLPNI